MRSEEASTTGHQHGVECVGVEMKHRSVCSRVCTSHVQYRCRQQSIFFAVRPSLLLHTCKV